MKKICISKGWLYNAPDHLGWTEVDLPNDYSIKQPRSEFAQGGASNGFFLGGIGSYLKKLNFDDAKHYILDIDGAYMLTQVQFNKKEVAVNPHGYMPFLVDLTDRIKRGEENSLMITTNGLQTSTRWYSGAGIYRDVFMWEGGDIRIEPWDVFVTTPATDRVNVSYEVSADRDAEIILRSEILDAENKSVTVKDTVLLIKKGKNKVRIEFILESPMLWEIENAYLYTLKSEIIEGKIISDTDISRFGIRTITVDAVNGLRINGKETKLRGGCIHHDHGVLGSADYPAACKRKLTKLKEAGFNALRIAHNPPSEQLMEYCDEMGIIIMDEAFDCWNENKGGLLNYHNYFAKCWEQDITNMVKRDRRHPSVICFSTGNEIPESRGCDDGNEWSARLAAKIRSLDPTRLVTSCTYQMTSYEEWADNTAAYFAPYDICGYNYLFFRYVRDHEQFPNRVIWGSETHTIRFFDSWKMVKENSYVIGDFTWTAYDNLGEAGTGASMWAREGHIDGFIMCDFPWRSCYQGDLDLCGYRRPQSYFREAVWLGNARPNRFNTLIFTTHPEHYGEDFSGTDWHWYDVLDTWTFTDKYLGKPVKCEVYTDADEIEWILNEKSLGSVKPIKAVATIDIPYERGKLVAVAYKNGIECGRTSLHTVGKASAVVLTPETVEFAGDNRDLCYIDITIVDKNGDRVPDSKAELVCEVNGGELMGIASGNPKNEDDYTSNVCHAFYGRAIAIIRAKKPADVTVTVSSDSLDMASVTVQAV